MPSIRNQLCAILPKRCQVNSTDLMAYYGIPGLFGPGVFQFRDYTTDYVDPNRDGYVGPASPSCQVILSPRALELSNQYLKEQNE